jgi:hypothetical protein
VSTGAGRANIRLELEILTISGVGDIGRFLVYLRVHVAVPDGELISRFADEKLQIFFLCAELIILELAFYHGAGESTVFGGQINQVPRFSVTRILIIEEV